LPIAALFQAMFAGSMAIDFGAAVLRTFSAFLMAFILFFGVSDISKAVIAAFSAFLLIVFNSAYEKI
jgi:hypothetical protein